MRNMVGMAASLVIMASGCTMNSESQQGTTNLKSVVVDGKSYDVFFDPYDSDHAIIFGKRSVLVESLPKEQIIAQGTPCKFDKTSMIAYHRSDMVHPSRPDLDNLGWVPVNCKS